MPIKNNPKLTNPQRAYSRGRLDFEIRGNRTGATKIKFVPELKIMMRERARRVAKAFRNSQKKHGIIPAEQRKKTADELRRARWMKREKKEYEAQQIISKRN